MNQYIHVQCHLMLYILMLCSIFFHETGEIHGIQCHRTSVKKQATNWAVMTRALPLPKYVNKTSLDLELLVKRD